jgi:hypothetical protein
MLEIRERLLKMPSIATVLLMAATAGVAYAQIPADDAVRIGEFHRLAAQIEDGIWPNWSHVPEPVLLVTKNGEFLRDFPNPPKDFHPVGDGFWTRPTQLPMNFQATMPLFGPPAVIVIGEPANTQSRTSTPWEIVMMHEHFHQLQDAQPGYFAAVAALGLSGGEKNGMWMLNYPFPYSRPDVVKSFGELRDQLLRTVEEPDAKRFRQEAAKYAAMRKQFFAQLSASDDTYLSFELWQEGVARYTQIRAGEAAGEYQPTKQYKALPDYQSFSTYAPEMRAQTLEELRTIDITKARREVVYSFGGTEGLLLDRLNPQWKSEYFKHLLSIDELFNVSTQ